MSQEGRRAGAGLGGEVWCVCVYGGCRCGVWASPGLAMLRWMAARSFLFHLCISSSILSMRARLSAHRQPLREDPLILFSTFSKHLFRDRLCRTEFFQPSGAVCGETRAAGGPSRDLPANPLSWGSQARASRASRTVSTLHFESGRRERVVGTVANWRASAPMKGAATAQPHHGYDIRTGPRAAGFSTFPPTQEASKREDANAWITGQVYEMPTRFKCS